MIFVTGDKHREFYNFEPRYCPEREQMNREDLVIICGDFGGIWEGEEEGDGEILDKLEQLPFTLLFVDGNHENFDLLLQYPVEEWNGGKVHRIRPHVLHLMRGQIFNLQGKTFFTMGGARCHDMDAVLEPDDPDFNKKVDELWEQDMYYRVHHESWWPEELPSEEEYTEAQRNLDAAGWKVDYVLTHCAPDSVQEKIPYMGYEPDHLTHFLEELRQKLNFQDWFFGHYHDNDDELEKKFHLLYDRMYRVV